MCVTIMVPRTRCETRPPVVVQLGDDGTVTFNPFRMNPCGHNNGRPDSHRNTARASFECVHERLVAARAGTDAEPIEAARAYDLDIQVSVSAWDEVGMGRHGRAGHEATHACLWHGQGCCEMWTYSACFDRADSHKAGSGIACPYSPGPVFHEVVGLHEDWLGNGPEVFSVEGVLPPNLHRPSDGEVRRLTLYLVDPVKVRGMHGLPHMPNAQRREEWDAAYALFREGEKTLPASHDFAAAVREGVLATGGPAAVRIIESTGGAVADFATARARYRDLEKARRVDALPQSDVDRCDRFGLTLHYQHPRNGERFAPTVEAIFRILHATGYLSPRLPGPPFQAELEWMLRPDTFRPADAGVLADVERAVELRFPMSNQGALTQAMRIHAALTYCHTPHCGRAERNHHMKRVRQLKRNPIELEPHPHPGRPR